MLSKNHYVINSVSEIENLKDKNVLVKCLMINTNIIVDDLLENFKDLERIGFNDNFDKDVYLPVLENLTYLEFGCKYINTVNFSNCPKLVKYNLRQTYIPARLIMNISDLNYLINSKIANNILHLTIDVENIDISERLKHFENLKSLEFTETYNKKVNITFFENNFTDLKK